MPSTTRSVRPSLTTRRRGPPWAGRGAAAISIAGVLTLLAVDGSAADRRPRADLHGYPWLSVTSPYSADPSANASRAGVPGLAPRSLASGDVDQDGVPDLAVGYATTRGGAVAVYRGNLDAIHPNAPEAQANRAAGRAVESPFLPAPAVHELAEVADFVAVGDFDADGRWDVVAAARGGRALYLLRGDAHGVLGEPEKTALPGALTALAAGDVNRRDGLDDLVVAVSGSAGDAALVFEDPSGALRAAPERIELPRPANDLAIGRLGDAPYAGFVAATGSGLTLVHGRDRQLAFPPGARHASAARRDSVAVGFDAVSVAVGELDGGYGSSPDIAALAADGAVKFLSRDGRDGRFAATRTITSGASRLVRGRLLVTSQATSVPLDEVLVVDGPARRLRLLESASDERAGGAGAPLVTELPGDGAPVAAIPMRLNKHAFSSLVVLHAGDPTPAVIEAAPTAIFTIDTTAFTNDLTGNDGLCLDVQGHCSLHAAQDQANFTPGLQEFDFAIPGPAPTIDYGLTLYEPVTIDGTTQPGYAGSPIVAISFSCNCSGIALGGSGAASNSTVRGLLLNGGLTPAIAFIPASNNIVEANWIGTDRTGQAPSSPANTTGITGYGGANNRIGGTVAAARNVISGNIGVGYTTNPSSHVVQGNYIGVSVDGLHAVGNGREGIEGVDTLMTIGGTSAGAGNVIAANTGLGGNGQISIGNPSGDPDTLLIQGNLIGTDRTGAAALASGGGSAAGVRSHSLQGTTIGGTSPAARNVIAGQAGNGVEFLGGATDFLVQGNQIGVASDGATPLGNGGHGVFVSGGGGTIGGSALGAPNRIAFNGGTGLCVPSSATVRFQQNSIFSNGQLGIDLDSGGACNGVSNNDPGDGDGGGNGQLNFPSITSAAGTNVQGTYSSTAATASYTLEFFSSASCDASGKGEGKTFRGSTVVNTDASGNAAFDATLASGIPTGQAVTATATDENGATSEFSGCTTAGGSTSVELDDVPQALQVGTTITLTGGGFTAGTVLKIYVGTANGPLDVLPDGLAPSAVTATSWTATLPFPWPVAAPNDTALGEGYAALQMVRTDNGYDTSNLVPAMLLGNPALAQPVPSITAINGIPLIKGSIGAPVSFVDGVAENTTVTLTGSGFSNAVVNLFTEGGNLGPITPDTQTSTSIELTLPPSTPVGPGSFQVVNVPSYRTSNAAVVQLLEPVFVQLVVVGDPTATVYGKGLNSLTVIQVFVVGFFYPDVGMPQPFAAKFGGLDGNGAPIIPLTVQDSHTATFPRTALTFPEGGTFLGVGWVEAINPPYVGETAKWGFAIGF